MVVSPESQVPVTLPSHSTGNTMPRMNRAAIWRDPQAITVSVPVSHQASPGARSRADSTCCCTLKAPSLRGAFAAAGGVGAHRLAVHHDLAVTHVEQAMRGR